MLHMGLAVLLLSLPMAHLILLLLDLLNELGGLEGSVGFGDLVFLHEDGRALGFV